MLVAAGVSLSILLFSGVDLAAAANSPGCGKDHGAGGTTTTVNVTSSSSIQRNFLIHLPSDYDAKKPYPVVFGFHGSGESAQEFEWDTRLSDAKYSKEKIMVYPSGINKSWAGASYSNSTIEDDFEFISNVLSSVRDNYCVDNNKIYAIGFSNGGGFVDMLACSDTVGKNFAAFAPCSGAYYQEHLYNATYKCKPARVPVPILFIHGGNDTDVPYNGASEGEGGFLPAVPIVVNNWVERNRCTSLEKKESFEGVVHHSSWDCSDVDDVLQHYKEDTMGHVWASTQLTFSQIFMGEGPTKIEAGELAMKFFDRFFLEDEDDSEPSGSFTAEPSVLLSTTQALGTVTPPTGPAIGLPTGSATIGAGTETASTVEPSISASQTGSFATNSHDLGLAKYVMGGITLMYIIIEVFR